MKQYTSAEMAQKTGLAERTIRKAAGANGIGRKIGRDWVFTDSDIPKIKAIVGKPRPRVAAPEPAPVEEGGTDGD